MASNGGGAKRQQIGEQRDFPFLDVVPDHHAAQQAGAILLGLVAAEPDELVRENIPVLWNGALLHHLKGGIFLQAREGVLFALCSQHRYGRNEEAPCGMRYMSPAACAIRSNPAPT